jgi:hypothetical protein
MLVHVVDFTLPPNSSSLAIGNSLSAGENPILLAKEQIEKNLEQRRLFDIRP